MTQQHSQSSANHPKQPRRLQALQRRRQALNMRLAGASEYEIAAALGVSQPRVSQLIGEAMADLKEAVHADAEEMREMQRRDIMAALQAVRKSLLSGDPGERMAASDRIARLWTRLSELYGLDAPKRADVTSGGEALENIVRIIVHESGNGSNGA